MAARKTTRKAGKRDRFAFFVNPTVQKIVALVLLAASVLGIKDDASQARENAAKARHKAASAQEAADRANATLTEVKSTLDDIHSAQTQLHAGVVRTARTVRRLDGVLEDIEQTIRRAARGG